MFGDLLGIMLGKDATEEEKAEAHRKHEREQRKRDQDRQRIMEVNGLLKQVDDIFNDNRH